MFTLCKSRYQAFLLKQRWNYLNQQFAVYQTAGEKMYPISSNLKLCNFQWQVLLCNNSESPEAYRE